VRGQAVKRLKRTIVKRSVVVSGRQTSVTVEDSFWEGLTEIANERRISVPALVTIINAERNHSNLSSAIRLFVLRHYQDQAERALVALDQAKERQTTEAPPD
jgi:predicted DNA-binding ribbon-helix-helix protein